MTGFEQLTPSSRSIHLVALLLVAFSIVLLMTPPAFHRIAERGAETQRFCHVVSTMLIAALVPLALGISLDVFVVVARFAPHGASGIVASASALGLFAASWFGYPLWRRRARQALPWHSVGDIEHAP